MDKEKLKNQEFSVFRTPARWRKCAVTGTLVGHLLVIMNLTAKLWYDKTVTRLCVRNELYAVMICIPTLRRGIPLDSGFPQGSFFYVWHKVTLWPFLLLKALV